MNPTFRADLRLTAEVNQVACDKTKSIQKSPPDEMLALNALIEKLARRRTRRGFCRVAQEVAMSPAGRDHARELESQAHQPHRAI